MSNPAHTLLLTSPHGEVTDPKTWSAIPKRVYDHISPHFSRCGTLNYQLPPFLDKAERVTFRLFDWSKGCRNRYFNSSYERQFLRKWNTVGFSPDACLHISDYCVPASLNGRTRHFVYTDSTIFGASKHMPNRPPQSFINAYGSISRRYLDSIHTVFTLNEWARRSYIEDHGMPAERVVNAGFGINMEPATGEKDWNKNLLVIVLRPKLEVIKGLTLLLEAFPMVRREIPDAELAVVGTQVNAAPEGVTCYFNQPRQKTIDLMRTATLFTMPALCEVHGIVYPEALASRTPILGLDRYAFPEFAGGGRYGFVVKQPDPKQVADAIIGALKDKQALKNMGEEGQKFVVDRFTWARAAETMSRTIHAACEG